MVTGHARGSWRVGSKVGWTLDIEGGGGWRVGWTLDMGGGGGWGWCPVYEELSPAAIIIIILKECFQFFLSLKMVYILR